MKSGGFVQKVKVFSSSDSIVQKLTQQSDGSCKVTSDSIFFGSYSRNNLRFSANTDGRSNLSKNYCIVRHYDNMCFLPKWRYHTKLRGDKKELQIKLDAFCSNNQHTDSLYTHLRYRFSGRMVAKSGQLCDNKQRAVRFNNQNRGVDRMPSIVKKTIMRKKSKKNVELLPKD